MSAIVAHTISAPIPQKKPTDPPPPLPALSRQSSAITTLETSFSDEVKPLSLKARVHHRKDLCKIRKSAGQFFKPEANLGLSLSIERIYSSPSLDGAKPRQLKFSPDGKRVTFLKAKADDAQVFDLWEYNISDKKSRLLVDSKSLTAIEEPLCKQEQNRRERLRLFDKGIVEYYWSANSKALLFPLGHKLFFHNLEKAGAEATKCLSDNAAGQTDILFSPQGNYISFVRSQNLYVIDIGTRKERQLTFDGSETITNGLAEFIAQEEMDRFEGYWWSPNEKYIAFFQVDESPVQNMARFEVRNEAIEVHQQRYPKTGTPNALVTLGVVEVSTGRIRFLKEVSENPDCYFARCQWLPDGETVSIQVQSRDQKTLDLICINVNTGERRRILTRTSPFWVDLDNDLYFLKKQDGFIWVSQVNNSRLLSLYEKDGTLKHNITSEECYVSSLLGVDEENGMVYFEGYRHSHLEKHLFSTPLDPKEPVLPKRITHRHGWHEINISIANNCYIDTYSDPNTPPQVTLNVLGGDRICIIEKNELNETHPYHPYLKKHAQVEFGTLKSVDGQKLYYSLLKPASFDPQKKYPVIVDVYGGPHFRKVKRAWGAGSGGWGQFMASRGYIVFSLDNRGSSDRGTHFESAIYHQLGKVEVEDQKTGVEYLRTLPFVDSERIGVFGWSYGGYMALMLMMKASSYFHAGIAVAPVTDWTLYDTHYTERYLGKPEENKAGYEQSSVFPYIDGLKGPLLVVHGMSDDNVFFQNSTKLYMALQKKNKSFEMMNYPSGKHSIAGNDYRRHLYEKNITPFFDRHLAQKNPNP